MREAVRPAFIAHSRAIESMEEPAKVDVLFLCTGNSCRSIMAEAMLRHLGSDRFAAHSAGSRPAGFIHPLAVHALSTMRIPLSELESKSWNEFADKHVDVAITLCDSAAAEACPNFPGTRFKVHWSLPDPAYHLGDETQRADFALLMAHRIRAKIEGLLAIDWASSNLEIQKRLSFLGDI